MGWAWGAAPLHPLVLADHASEAPCALHRLQAGLPPYSPVFKSWIHCWKYLSVQVGVLGWGRGEEGKGEEPGGADWGEGRNAAGY